MLLLGLLLFDAFRHVVECQANRWEMAQTIVEAGSSWMEEGGDVCCCPSCQDLRSGTTIVCDRYAFSGVAYSAAKGLGCGRCAESLCAFMPFAACDSGRAGLHVVPVPGSRAALPGWHLLPAHRREGRLCRSAQCGRRLKNAPSWRQVGASRSNFGDERYENAQMQVG